MSDWFCKNVVANDPSIKKKAEIKLNNVEVKWVFANLQLAITIKNSRTVGQMIVMDQAVTSSPAHAPEMIGF